MRPLLALLIALAVTSTAIAQNEQAPNRDQVLKAIGYYRDVPAAAIKTGAIEPRRAAAANSEFGDEEITCLTPVFADAELANMAPQAIRDAIGYPLDVCEDIREMHQSLLDLQKAQATGSGSFPDGCLDEFPANHAVYYFVDRSSFPAWTKNNKVSDRWLKRIPWQLWGFKSYQQVVDRFGGLSHLDASIRLGIDTDYGHEGCGHFETDDQSKANIYVRSRYIPGSVIGYATFNSGHCGSEVTLTIDNSWHPGEDGHSYAHLFGHECGHNNNLQHQFTNQSGSRGHHERMSYSPPSDDEGFTIMYPYSDGSTEHPLPEAPSDDILARYYGDEQFPYPGTDPTDPTDPKPTGDFPYKIGDEIVQLTLGRRMTLIVAKIDGDEGPTFTDKIAEAYAAIKPYSDKDKHRATMASLYFAMSQTVGKESTVEDAHATIELLSGFLLRSDAAKWADVFAVAKTATTADGFAAVAKGLGYAPRDKAEWTATDMVLAVGSAQKMVSDGAALSPEIMAIIKLVLNFLPDGPLKTIISIVLAILEGFPGEEGPAVEPIKTTYAQPKNQLGGITLAA